MYKGLKENYRELAFKTQKSVEESAKKFPSYGEEANVLFINDFETPCSESSFLLKY